MTMRYLFVDDEAGGPSPADLYGERLEAASSGRLVVVARRPVLIGDTVAFVKREQPDGLLLDIDFSNAPAGYDGTALAQQVRTLQTRGVLHEFPVLRLSKRPILANFVRGDTTSDDLFDATIVKEQMIDADTAGREAERAHTLAADYPRVGRFASGDRLDEALADLLACAPEFLVRVDPRATLGLRRPDAPAHLLARYLTGALLGRPGVVCDEALLAIRLGVDRDTSPGWPALVEKLIPAAYHGTFAAGYPRWWLALVLDWWQSAVDSDRTPSRLAAAERVAALKGATKIAGLEPLREDPDSPGLRFWHRCAKSQRPVDPAYGVALLPAWGQETWQDAEYLCLEEALQDPRDPRISASERGRLFALRTRARR